MGAILIKIKEGHKMDGEGEYIGKDVNGDPYTFWRSSGHMEVPAEIAIRLEQERPQRFEMVDRTIAAQYILEEVPAAVIEPVVEAPPVEPTIEDKLPETTAIEIEPEVIDQPTAILDDTLELKSEPEELITIAEIKDMTKDKMNDWAAINGYNLKPRWLKAFMVNELVKQIEEKTGQKLKKK